MLCSDFYRNLDYGKHARLAHSATHPVQCRDHTSASGKNKGGSVCVYVNNRWCVDTQVVEKHGCANIKVLMVKCRPFYLFKGVQCSVSAGCLHSANAKTKRLARPNTHQRDSSGEGKDLQKDLGIHISEDLTWTHNTWQIIKKAHQRLFFLRKLRKFGLPTKLFSNFCRCSGEYPDKLHHHVVWEQHHSGQEGSPACH